MIIEIKEAIKNKDVKFLAKYLFPHNKAAKNLTPTQIKIVRKIAYIESKRISISAYTRYGKTQCVAIGIAIFILLNTNKKIAFIGPEREQAGLLRDYMSELILDCKMLLDISDIETVGVERIKKEASKNRMTFKNGCEYRVFTAHGEARGLMGFGADIIIPDEACLISRTAYAKILRMLGDDAEKAVLIELYNPWNRDTKAFDHTLDSNYDVLHIGWEVGVKEGRTTEEFINEQRREISPMEFTVLYDSRFPEEGPDSLFNLSKIILAENKNWNFENELQEIENKLRNAHKYTESEIATCKIHLQRYKRIVACDPADKGLDETVIYWGTQKENKFQLVGYYSEPKSESMEIVGYVINKMETFIRRKVSGLIDIDKIGIGTGAHSRLREVRREKGYDNVKIVGCHFGEGAIVKDNYINKKSENYFRLQALFNEEMISIPKKMDKLKRQLMAMRWKFTSSNKKIIQDPDDYSPDWADALVYFVWKDSKGLSFGFA